MEEREITKEEAEKYMALEGETRGFSISGDAEFVLKEKGEEGLKKLEAKMAELGYPIKYKELKPMKFYPLGIEALTLILIKKLFGFDEKKFEEMGKFNSQTSLIIRLFLKYFGSLKMLAKQAPTMWKNYYSSGNLEVTEVNKKERYVILKIKNFKLHPLHCLAHKGYFANIVKMVVKKPVVCEETKCPFRGDDYHEFVLRW